MQLAADFVDGLFDGAVLEGGEMDASRGGGGDFERVVFRLIVDVLYGPDGGGHQVDVAVAVFFAGGRLRSAGLRGKRKRAWRRDLRPGILCFGLELGASGGESDAVNRHVDKLRPPQDFAQL